VGLLELCYAGPAVGVAVLAPRIPCGLTVPAGEVRAALLATAASILPFVGIVFSLLFLVVQHSATTLTPRLNLFHHAPIVWHAFSYFGAVFVLTFLEAFLVGGDGPVTAVVPAVAGLAVAAMFWVFRALQFEAFTAIQLGPALADVGERARRVIDETYPAPRPATGPAPPGPPVSGARHDVLWPHPAGVVQAVDPALTRAAEAAGVVIEFCVGPGTTLLEGDRVAVVHGPPSAAVDAATVGAVTVGVERVFEHDPALGLRVLADIALRALSPAVNDPSTAVQALDGIEDLLRVLARRDLDAGTVPDASGTPRVLLALPSWEAYLGVALDEVIPAAAAAPRVGRRITRLLEHLAETAPPDLVPPVSARLSRGSAPDHTAAHRR
jgi:uncharacterized membrane protein